MQKFLVISSVTPLIGGVANGPAATAGIGARQLAPGGDDTDGKRAASSRCQPEVLEPPLQEHCHGSGREDISRRCARSVLRPVRSQRAPGRIEQDHAGRVDEAVNGGGVQPADHP